MKSDPALWRSGYNPTALSKLKPFDSSRNISSSSSSLMMIPTKMLVYRGPDGDTLSEAVHNTRRRKKSCADLFQNGYRVKLSHAHGPVREENRADGASHTLASCFRLLAYWGKEWTRITSVLLNCCQCSDPGVDVA